jgi:hypothetical protein
LDIAKFLMERTLARGRRCREIQLVKGFTFSIDFGIYLCAIEGQHLHIYDTSTMWTMVLPNVFKPLSEGHAKLWNRLSIVNNFSRSLASLKIKGITLERDCMQDMFLSAGFGVADFSARAALKNQPMTNEHGEIIVSLFTGSPHQKREATSQLHAAPAKIAKVEKTMDESKNMKKGERSTSPSCSDGDAAAGHTDKRKLEDEEAAEFEDNLDMAKPVA